MNPSTDYGRAIQQLEARMRKQEQVEIVERHHFSDGIYAREITVPAGIAFIGKVHKHQNLNIISKGRIAVTTFEGTAILEAPCTIVSPPGTQRAAYALEETVWTTIHGTHETDLDILEAAFVTDTLEQYLEFEQQRLEE
jgi:hypothetical protein